MCTRERRDVHRKIYFSAKKILLSIIKQTVTIHINKNSLSCGLRRTRKISIYKGSTYQKFHYILIYYIDYLLFFVIFATIFFEYFAFIMLSKVILLFLSSIFLVNPNFLRQNSRKYFLILYFGQFIMNEQ